MEGSKTCINLIKQLLEIETNPKKAPPTNTKTTIASNRTSNEGTCSNTEKIISEK